MTFETYYPAPFGVYNEMRAKKMAIGDTYYNGSQYCWSPATCSNQIDGVSSPCWPDCNTDLVVEGNVGIGTTAPGAKLEVAGQVKITGGTPAAGRVLTSDSDGLATWEPPGVPSGAVMFFNLASCPAGWTAVAAAQGRYLVGLPAAGTLGGTAGSALSNLESRAAGVHAHGLTDPGHNHEMMFALGYPGPLNQVEQPGLRAPATSPTGTRTTGITVVNSVGVAGTTAPYWQLLVCQAD